MADDATPIATLIEKAEGFGKTNIELLKLHVVDKSADMVSSLVSSLAIFVAVALSLLIVNIGLALWIGKLLGDTFYGFFVVGGFYALLTLPLYIYREKWVKYPVSNSMIKQMLNKK
jgi:hypothetical protein